MIRAGAFSRGDPALFAPDRRRPPRRRRPLLPAGRLRRVRGEPGSRRAELPRSVWVDAEVDSQHRGHGEVLERSHDPSVRRGDLGDPPGQGPGLRETAHEREWRRRQARRAGGLARIPRLLTAYYTLAPRSGGAGPAGGVRDLGATEAPPSTRPSTLVDRDPPAVVGLYSDRGEIEIVGETAPSRRAHEAGDEAALHPRGGASRPGAVLLIHGLHVWRDPMAGWLRACAREVTRTAAVPLTFTYPQWAGCAGALHPGECHRQR